MSKHYVATRKIATVDEKTKNNIHQKPLKSTSGRRCLTKCFPNKEKYLHPIIMRIMYENADNTCAIDPIINNYDEMKYCDICRLEDNNKYIIPNELNSLLLDYYFNPNDFLDRIYKLYTFDQVIKWTLENEHLPFGTIKRVHNCAWKAFGDKLDNISDSLLDYYYDVAKTKWIYDYIDVIKNKYSFDFIIKDNSNLPIKQIHDILIDKFLSQNFFRQTIQKYLDVYQDEWSDVKSHYGNLKNFIFKELLREINYFNEK